MNGAEGKRKRRFFRSLRARIGLQMLLMSLVPLILMAILGYWTMSTQQYKAQEQVDESRTQLEEEVVGINLQRTATSLAREMNQFLEERAGDLSQWAKAPAVLAAIRTSSVNDTAINTFLAEQMTFSVYYNQLGIADASGTMLNSVKANGVNSPLLGVNHADTDWWQGAWTSGTHVSPIVFSPSYNAYAMNMSARVLERVLNERKDTLNQRHLTVHNAVNNEIIVSADEPDLHELVDNLVLNAIKFTPPGGTITCEAVRQADAATLSIKDTGIGMTEDQLSRVFDEFYKADPSRHDLESSGLGLAICKRLVEKLGGRIWAESEGPGEGSTIHFTLKLAESDVQVGEEAR